MYNLLWPKVLYEFPERGLSLKQWNNTNCLSKLIFTILFSIYFLCTEKCIKVFNFKQFNFTFIVFFPLLPYSILFYSILGRGEVESITVDWLHDQLYILKTSLKTLSKVKNARKWWWSLIVSFSSKQWCLELPESKYIYDICSYDWVTFIK